MGGITGEAWLGTLFKYAKNMREQLPNLTHPSDEYLTEGPNCSLKMGIRRPVVLPLTLRTLLRKRGWLRLRGYWRNTLSEILPAKFGLGKSTLSSEKGTGRLELLSFHRQLLSFTVRTFLT